MSVTLNLDVVWPEDPGSPDDLASVREIETIGNDIWLAAMLEGCCQMGPRSSPGTSPTGPSSATPISVSTISLWPVWGSTTTRR